MLTVQQIKDTVTDYFKDKPVRRVYLFGSYARGEANEKSDIDILFSLAENTRINYFGLAQYLVDLESRFLNKVDMVEEEHIYPRLKKYIDRDKILLFSK
ncbi:nucleotidyltransferase family protein [Nemorincola caseinilytica]|uniref:Nucleotidyltransferase family protein n=1 Tax=Nemorincola caseinilytica TaxID=2054315 RepID=A0ABP8NFF8_9BACT